MISYSLTPEEAAEAVNIGYQRQGCHGRTDRNAQRTGSRAASEHIVGALAERALESLSGGKIPMDRELRSAGDGGIDSVLVKADGSRVRLNLKARSGDWDLMLVDVRQVNRADLYIHANVDEKARTVTFYGAVWAATLTQQPEVPPRNQRLAATGRRNYEFSRDDLPMSMKEFMQMTEQMHTFVREDTR